MQNSLKCLHQVMSCTWLHIYVGKEKVNNFVNVFQLVQRCFSAWYSVVASQRIKVGKARAMSDWRCKLRAWNAWQAYVNHIRSDREAQAVTLEMKEKYR